MEILLKHQKNEIKIDISKINDWKSLQSLLKEKLSFGSDKEIDIYTQPDNIYLKESNFSSQFLNQKSKISGLLIMDVVDLEDKLKNLVIDTDNIPNNEIVTNSTEFFDQAQSVVLGKKIFSEKCKICGGFIDYVKYSCLLCDNLFLCSNCEAKHNHPMVKYKINSLSDDVNKIIFVHSLKDNKKDKKSLTLRTNISSNSFSMGNNQQREISLIIKNQKKLRIPENTLNLVIKNNFDLNIIVQEENVKKEIKGLSEMPISLQIKSNNKNIFKKYEISFEVISNNLDIISNSLIIKINIIDDKEDNDLNDNFRQFPSIMLLSKEKKKKIKYIIDEKLSLKTPQQVRAIMDKFKWNIDEAIVDLTN